MDDTQPDPQASARLARQTLSSSERRKKYRKIDFLDTSFWYPSQLAFFAAGSSGVHQRLIYGGSQSGKTTAAAFEVAQHLTGEYAPFWTGKRFDKPIRAWAVGESTMLVRDSLQRKLCGDDEIGTGMVPLEAFNRKPVMIPGGTGAIDTIYVTHQTDGVVDGVSSLSFRSYEQSRQKLQAESVSLVWADEKPPEDIFSELLARTSATDGHVLVSFTPIGAGGASGVTYKFLSEPSSDRAVFRISGAEARHISEQRRAELAASYSDAELETRLEGHPQLGSGPVFPVELLPGLTKAFTVDHYDIPDTALHIVGIDFGYQHPFAACWIAFSRETQHVWVIDSFAMTRSSAMYHVQRIFSMCRGLRLPIAWPHDGHTHDKGSGLSLSKQYAGFGARMLSTHAVNRGTGTNAVEPALAEITEMMHGGRLHIANCNRELLDELRNYHRDEDYRIVKQRDDLVSAFRYAVMMRHHGKPLAACDGIGYGTLPLAAQRPQQRPQQARGTDFDLFTGGPLE